MKVSVFGLGYVGCVTAACLARDGHTVIGVDVNPQKVEMVNSGQAPIAEAGLEDLLATAVEDGRLSATIDSAAAVEQSEISLVCVGTPSNGNGSLGVHYVERVCDQIGTALARKLRYHVVVIRSTVLPGTVESVLVPILEAKSGKRAGVDFGVCTNPEFLREGKAIDDYYHPSHVVIGEMDRRSGAIVEQLYHAVEAPVVHTTVGAAEMVKYASNAFHALKVVFANEIGNLCDEQGIDGREVMEIFRRDQHLNISPAYLKPGFAFGGSCLPKDLRALLHRAKELDLESPLMSAILQSNQRQIARSIDLVERAGGKKISVLGLSFKAGTDDVRESPVIPLVETLMGRGYEVTIFDDKVDPARLIGSNKAFLDRELPHIASNMRASLRDVVEHADVVVVANANPAFRHVRQMMREDQALVDLVGIVTYEGAVVHEKAA